MRRAAFRPAPRSWRAVLLFSASALAAPALAAAEPATGEREAPPLIRSSSHAQYEPLESAEARKLLDLALAFGERRLGKPVIAVRKVNLRRSIPLKKDAKLPESFQRTEITDSREGEFTVYVSARPGETAFPGQVAHEAFHLFNARARDVYVEGLNCLLAEELLRSQGLDWGPWLRHFQSGKDPLYGAAYFLVRELASQVGRDSLDRLFQSAVETPSNREKMEIDIDRWIDSLGAAGARARAVILRHHPALEALRRAHQPELAFRRPE